MTASITRSVRVPPGLPEKVQAATGMNFSEFVRVVAESTVRAFEQRRDMQSLNQTSNAAIDKIVDEELSRERE